MKTKNRGFPDGLVVKNPPANAGGTGLTPGPGRSHMPWANQASAPQLLSQHSRACKLQILSLCAETTKPHSATREATAMRSPHAGIKSNPHSPQLEKVATETQHNQKQKQINQSFLKIDKLSISQKYDVSV